jgi:hypothetical protein
MKSSSHTASPPSFTLDTLTIPDHDQPHAYLASRSLDVHMPEPSSLVLVGTGLVASAVAGRKVSDIRDFLRGQFSHVHDVLLRFLPRSNEADKSPDASVSSKGQKNTAHDRDVLN